VRPDLVVNLAESFDDKSALDSSVTALLNLLGLRYTGSSPAGLIAAGDKSLTKKILSFHGIQTPQFATLYRGAVDWAGDLTFPVIVKPPQEDASLGITSASVVREIKDLFDRIGELQLEYQGPVLVEQYIEGREFYVGVLGNVNVEALPIIELDFSGFPADRPRIASWAAKWGDDGEGSGAEFAGTKSIFPEGLDPELVSRMQKVAIDSFQALRLRDYARIDLRVSPEGEIYVIEVNPNCYLEKESEFARAAQKSGLEYQDLIARIIDLATARYSR
jgi:D-alanine-D-alanine ligase